MSFATCTSKVLIFGTFFTSCAHNNTESTYGTKSLESCRPSYVERSKLTFLTHKLLPAVRKLTICHKRKYDFAVGGSIIVKNEYPISFLKRCRTLKRKEKNNDEEDKPLTTAKIPYVERLGEEIRRILKDYNIRTVFKTIDTLGKILTKVKDPTPPEERPGVIYKIRCICGDFYVGETKRTLATGLRLHADSEHLKDPQLPSTHGRRAMRSIGTTWRSSTQLGTYKRGR